MRCFSLLSFYNEAPAMLAAGISSLAPFTDHLIAVDGAYSLYPDAQPCSPGDQTTTIRDVAAANRIGLTLYQPSQSWVGNEVEKRSFMFQLAEAHAEANVDWYYIADGDELVTGLHVDPKPVLEETEFDSAEVSYWWHRPHETPQERPFATPLKEQQGIAKFFRAVPGLHVDTAHYRYRAGDGRMLWNPGPGEKPGEPADLRAIYVQHRNQERDLWRSGEAQEYYTRRDANRIEAAA